MTRLSPDEFAPLPHYSWHTRPETLELDPDECATALFLSDGDLKAAAARLKVDLRRLKKAVRRNGRLQVLLDRLAAAGA